MGYLARCPRCERPGKPATVALSAQHVLTGCVHCGWVSETSWGALPLVWPVRHRRPPTLPWMVFPVSPKGVCRWCAGAITARHRLRPRSSNWHTECLCEYRQYYDWEYCRWLVSTVRDNQTCRACGATGKPTQVDHIHALWEWGPRSFQALNRDNCADWMAPWGIDNLQTLCGDCHSRKTAEDSTRRSVHRRVQRGEEN